MRNQYETIAATLFGDERAAATLKKRRQRMEKLAIEAQAKLENTLEQIRDTERKRDAVEREAKEIIADCQYRREKAERDTDAEVTRLQKKAEALCEGFWLGKSQRQWRICLAITLALASFSGGALFIRFVVQ